MLNVHGTVSIKQDTVSVKHGTMSIKQDTVSDANGTKKVNARYHIRKSQYRVSYTQHRKGCAPQLMHGTAAVKHDTVHLTQCHVS